MKSLCALVTIVVAATSADAEPKLPRELANVTPAIDVTGLKSLKLVGARTVGTHTLVAWEEEVERDTNRCCDIAPGTDTTLYVADETGKRIFDRDIASIEGDEVYARYDARWQDVDKDGAPELVLTLVKKSKDAKELPREELFRVHGDKLVQVTRAELARCKLQMLTPHDAVVALAAAGEHDAFCAYANVQAALEAPLADATAVFPVRRTCPSFAWSQRNEPDRATDPELLWDVYLLRDGRVYESQPGMLEDPVLYEPAKGRVTALHLIPNGDRPFLVAEVADGSKHRVVLFDPNTVADRMFSKGEGPLRDEPLQPGEHVTVHDRVIEVGPAKGAARLQWTYDPAADAWH